MLTVDSDNRKIHYNTIEKKCYGLVLPVGFMFFFDRQLFCDVTEPRWLFAMFIIKLNWWLFAVLAQVLVLVNSQNVHKRFEYKYSFKPPYLAQKDGSVPFWEYGGSKY